MAKCIVIDMENGYCVVVRSILETATEPPLSDEEQAINFLYEKVKKLNKLAVSKCNSLERKALLIDFERWKTINGKRYDLSQDMIDKYLEYLKSINNC